MASTTQEYQRSSLLIDPQYRERVFETFRRWGYLQAQLDPLGQYLAPQMVPELDVQGDFANEARRYYCGTIAAEFMHIQDAARREWIQERLEGEPAPVDQKHILELLTKADLFEQVIQSRYLGTKRFSLEGVTALIPFLDELLNEAADRGSDQVVIAMSHRRGLIVIVNTVGKSASDLVAKFEDVDPRSTRGGGDVKYHQGATGTFTGRGGQTINLHLVSNPSHLEAVDPVATGRVRAKQIRMGGEEKVLPVMIHGDAAFAGQGIWAETMNLAAVDGYTVGGGLHIIANNLIGFTTEPCETNSSRYSTDIAKRLPIPIFHVNAEDPDAVLRIAKLAIEWRYTFHSDVVVDLVGYRRHGHSEVDDPTITQPIRYARIKDHPPLHEIYAKRIGVDSSQRVQEITGEIGEAQKQATKLKKMPRLAKLPEYWDNYHGGRFKPEYDVETGISTEQVGQIADKLASYPKEFHIHPKIKKLLEQRAEMGHGKRAFDYGMAEALAFGSLLLQEVPVRLSGQDCKRGTFNQRHSVLIDIEDETEYIPLNHLAPEQAKYEVYNSILSEAGVLGFEYGYSRDYPESLVLWEAQFGDFANGAQIVSDQFIAAAEDEWGLLSGIVLLLPPGYEGQAHVDSSTAIERFLQLAARDNIQIAQPSNAAQYFHLLRRQALRAWRKPLIALTPKSMLRHPDAASPVEELSRERFLPVLP